MSNTFEIITYIVAVAFPVFALLDVYRKRASFNLDLMIWTAVIVLIPFLGTILYYLIGTSRRR